MADETPSVRDRIIEAARKLFLSKGYHGSNLRDIAREAQVSMGGIYHHFASKEEIYEALLPATELARAIPGIAVLFRAPEFPDNLPQIARALRDLVRNHRDEFKLVYIDILEFQAHNVLPLIGVLHRAFIQESRALLGDRQEAGEVVDVHPAVATRCILDLFLHFFLEEAMLETSLATQIGLTDDELADQMALLLLHGIRGRKPAA